MSRLKYVRHCLCNTLYVYCRGRAVTNVGKTCGPTPCFILAINTFKLNPISSLIQMLKKIGQKMLNIKSGNKELIGGHSKRKFFERRV